MQLAHGLVTYDCNSGISVTVLFVVTRLFFFSKWQLFFFIFFFRFFFGTSRILGPIEKSPRDRPQRSIFSPKTGVSKQELPYTYVNAAKNALYRLGPSKKVASSAFKGPLEYFR
uniref:Uncharacterized protein n=1 Tax=Cacopsylla melanoneura TaxID=428564 RepID=A0A8D8Y4B9_9HEMI